MLVFLFACYSSCLLFSVFVFCYCLLSWSLAFFVWFVFRLRLSFACSCLFVFIVLIRLLLFCIVCVFFDWLNFRILFISSLFFSFRLFLFSLTRIVSFVFFTHFILCIFYVCFS